MKNYLITSILLLCITFSGCRQTHVTPTKVVKNCTGTYLHIDEKNYAVCNEGILNGYNDGDAVNARYRKIDSCKEAEGRVVCKLLFPSEGWIYIIDVKK